MSYRSIKRVLGESNLARKCRWLFGLSVGGLVLLAFWSADRIAEGLINNTAERKARDIVRVTFFNMHWQELEKSPESKMLQELLAKELAQEAFESRIIKLDPVPEPLLAETLLYPPETPEETKLLQELRREAEEKLSSQPAEPLETDVAEFEPSPIYRRALAGDQDRYYYVVQWKSICMACHEGMHGKFAQSAASYEGTAFDSSSTPFRVVRVTMPYAETRSAIHFTRAVLATVGIITVFLSMIALWLVVRYVVIKPLEHLSEVSVAVTRGDLSQRADIHTNDEFEDLAEAFNKMLRHLLEAQGELREANEELDGKVDELARLNMQLHEVNRLKGEFLATMSHELRTPLNSIIGFSEVLQGIDALNDKQKRYVQNIRTSGRQLLDMINDILDLAKMEAGKMEVRLSEFPIDRVIRAQCDLVRQLAEEKNIDLAVEIENDLPMLYQDQTKVQQILNNLLSNAIKFTPEGGRITVGAKGDARGRIEFWVSDTGVGIPDSEKDVIFEKFRQGKSVLGHDSLTREFSGTGLGLSIVKELCKLLGGEVTVESQLGKGSTFRVVIPWMRADQPTTPVKLSAKLDELSRPRVIRPEPAVEVGVGPASE